MTVTSSTAHMGQMCQKPVIQKVVHRKWQTTTDYQALGSTKCFIVWKNVVQECNYSQIWL